MHKGLQWRGRPEWDIGCRLGWHGEKGSMRTVLIAKLIAAVLS